MILSSSGWRKVFAESGDEEDATCEIRNETAMLTALAALALARTLGVPAAQKQAVLGGEAPKQEREATILVGLDARPTGRILGDIVCRTLTALGCKVRYLFICAAPQIMADCNLHPDEADAFFYISASHNPIGHNRFKFGKDGGVYSLKESR
jgi:phosphomannomutase